MGLVFQTASSDKTIMMRAKQNRHLSDLERGLFALGKALMIVLSLSMSIVLQCPSHTDFLLMTGSVDNVQEPVSSVKGCEKKKKNFGCYCSLVT